MPSVTNCQMLIGGVERRSADRTELVTIAGRPLATVHEGPPLLARLVVRTLRGPIDAPSRAALLTRAGEAFATATLAGETPADYCRHHALATGIPRQVAERGLTSLAGWLAAIGDVVAAEVAPDPQPPRGTDDPLAVVRRVPRGRVLAVGLPNNHPETSTSWLHAYALGYAVVVRPGHRDPFTPSRLIRALLEAGAGSDTVAFIPGPHETLRALLAEADLGLVYGDEATVAPYIGRATIAVRGPGRTKVLLTGQVDDNTICFLTHAVAADAGVRCGNVSLVLTTADHSAVADRLAATLAAMPALPPEHPDAVLPARSADDARRLDAQVRALGADDRSEPLYSDGPVTALGDGSAVLRPRVLQVDTVEHPAVGTELPLPFVVVAPWHPGLGIAPLRHSQSVVFLSDNTEALAAEALAEPSIAKVVRGAVPPWWTRPGLPHEDSLTSFLLAAKADITP